MFCGADWPVAVVIDLNVFWAPGHRDGKVRCETETDSRTQALRPRRNRAKGCLAPVHRPDQFAHLAAADQPWVKIRMLQVTAIVSAGHRMHLAKCASGG